MTERPLDDALGDLWILEGEIPLGRLAEGSSWHRARSARTGREAVLFVVRGPAALEAADAARRAHLVEHPGLLGVLDVDVLEEGDGADGAITAISYPFPPAAPLAALLGRGALRPETARSVIGEVATALEAARRRGLVPVIAR